jgi:two-component system, NtrC family, sensor histidine kinase KinB
MKLRTRLLLALLPIAAVMLLLGGAAIRLTGELGELSSRILKDNYRSVLAAQRMKEAIERLDSAAAFRALGEEAKAAQQERPNFALFEEELKAQEGNITEPGEAEVTRELHARWEAWKERQRAFCELPLEARRARYFAEMEPAFAQVKLAAGKVLELNQAAMVRKSDEARSASARSVTLAALATLLALAAGIFTSGLLTQRALLPLGRLQAAVRRLAQGDLTARSAVAGEDEIALLSQEFDAMAQSLESYRRSSLGELLAAQQSSQAAIDSLPDPVIVLSAGSGISNVNEAANALLGVCAGGQGEEPLAAAPPAIRAVLEKVQRHVLSGKGPYVPRGFEESVRLDAEDGVHFLLPRAAPVRSEETGLLGVSVVLQDVTRLMRFDELKNDLVATVAHEFRTPLTSLRMAIHLCLEGLVGPLTPKQEEMLQAGRADCERLQGIVDDLLDLSRLQSGKAEVELQRKEAAALLEGAIEARRDEAARAQISLQREPSPPLPAVLADPERIALVLGNLVSNALRYAPEGSQIQLGAEEREGAVRFWVRDGGPGLSREHQQRVFDKFFRGPGAKGPGVGLGLYIAREIVQAHGGEIGVESAPGQGARFWFTLPIAR